MSVPTLLDVGGDGGVALAAGGHGEPAAALAGRRALGRGGAARRLAAALGRLPARRRRPQRPNGPQARAVRRGGCRPRACHDEAARAARPPGRRGRRRRRRRRRHLVPPRPRVSSVPRGVLQRPPTSLRGVLKRSSERGRCAYFQRPPASFTVGRPPSPLRLERRAFCHTPNPIGNEEDEAEEEEEEEEEEDEAEEEEEEEEEEAEEDEEDEEEEEEEEEEEKEKEKEEEVEKEPASARSRRREEDNVEDHPTKRMSTRTTRTTTGRRTRPCREPRAKQEEATKPLAGEASGEGT